MSMLRTVSAVAAVLAGGAVFAQDGATDALRTVADVPDELAETGERAPAPVPTSSADAAGEIDPSAGVFGIGLVVTPEEIAAIDIDVMPDGSGLPKGGGTYAEGEALYEIVCSSCHGADLEGVPDLGAPRLIGGRDTLGTDTPVKTVESYWPYASTVFDYIHRAMPMNEPGSLTPDEVYAISAYVLGRAGIIDTSTELDADSFREIKMPNADGFVSDPRPDAE